MKQISKKITLRKKPINKDESLEQYLDECIENQNNSLLEITGTLSIETEEKQKEVKPAKMAQAAVVNTQKFID